MPEDMLACAMAALDREAEGDVELAELRKLLSDYPDCPACLIKALTHCEPSHPSRAHRLLLAALARELAEQHPVPGALLN